MNSPLDRHLRNLRMEAQEAARAAFPDVLNPDDVRTLVEAGRTLREALRLWERGKYTEAAEQARVAQMWLADCAEYQAANSLEPQPGTR